jgi:intracellular septation protein A
LAPVAAFYLAFRVDGLLAGVVLAAIVGTSLYILERRRGRAGQLARLSLAFVLLQAGVGVLSRSVTVYFVQPVVIDLVLATVFIGSAVLKRPVTAAPARDAFPFPPEVRDSRTYSRVFSRMAVLWGVYFLLRAAVRFVAVRTGQVETILVVNAVSDIPPVMGLMLFSVWYSVRSFRASSEWGPAIAALAEQSSPVLPLAD